MSNFVLSICMIFRKIILDMFSCENSIYCCKMQQFDIKKTEFLRNPSFLMQIICDYLLASSIATATATVMPTMGLLPAPDNRHRASLQAGLQASRGRLLRERCAKRNKVRSTKHQATRRCLVSEKYEAHHLYASGRLEYP